MVPLQILESLSSDLAYLVVLKVQPSQESHASEAVGVEPGDVVLGEVEHS